MIFTFILAITGFVRTLLVILLIWYAIKLVTRYIFPALLNKTVKNMQSRMEEQIRDRQRNLHKEGEVTVDRQTRSRNSPPNEGEYVDFEEVE